MSNSCLDEKKFKKKCPPPMDCCGKDILFRKVIIPIAMGDDTQYPPENGAFRNALVEYEANHALYIYSSDGLYTKLSVPSGVTSVNGMYGDVTLDIPEKVSQLINDLGFITKNADDLVNYTKTTNLAAVALSGSYNDLLYKPAINNGELTITRNGSALGSFKANQSQNVTMNVQVPTTTAELINNSQFVVDANYVHTDKNFTAALNNKLNHLAEIYEIGNNLTLSPSGRLDANVPAPTPVDSYYDATWVLTENPTTQTHYDELAAALNDNKRIIISGGGETYEIVGGKVESDNISIVVLSGSVVNYDGTNYAENLVVNINIDANTLDVATEFGTTNGADIYEKLDDKEILFYDASWTLSQASATQEQYDELKFAIDSQRRILVTFPDGSICTVVKQRSYSDGELLLNGENSYFVTHNGVKYPRITCADIRIDGTTKQITIDQQEIQSDVILQALDGKANYYDASWIFSQSTATITQFNNLTTAITNGDIILMNSGNEHYVVSGALTNNSDLEMMIQLSTVDSYNGTDYANVLVAFINIDHTTRDITVSVGQTNGADIYEKLDDKLSLYDASWVLTQSTASQSQFDELEAAINNRNYIYLIYPDGAVVTIVRSLVQNNGNLLLNGQVSYINTQNGVDYAGLTAGEIIVESGSKQIRVNQANLDGYSIQQALDTKIEATDYATNTTGGTLKITNSYGVGVNANGELYGTQVSASDYPTMWNDALISKGTLTNNYYDKPTANTFGGMFMPSTEHMTPIKTIEYDTSSTTFYKFCSFANNSSVWADLRGEALFRVTVTNTAGTIHHIFEMFISMKNAVNTYPYIMIRNWPATSSASTTGVRYSRNLYPRALNNGANWDFEFQTYNASERHFKIEVFQADPKFTFYETPTATTIDSDLQNGGSTQLYTTDGFWVLGNNINMTVNTALAANYISSYLNKFVSGTLPQAAQAILAQQMVFLGTDNKFHPATNNTTPIDPNVGVQLCSNAVNANAAVPASGLRQKYNNATLTNIPHATLTAGDRCFFRCTMDGSGNILSDNYVATTMSPGYTWYYIGNATSATAINHDTTQSMFYTLDANGKLTHLNGLPIA